jgi:hypothetical protein
VNFKLDELLNMASRPVNCSATILSNQGVIGSANLDNNQIVCTDGQDNTKTLIHIAGPDTAEAAEPAKPGKSEYVAIYSGQMKLGPRGVTVADTIMASNPWSLLYKMLEAPRFANDVETPISTFERNMKMFVSKYPATCRKEMDAAEANIRAHIGHESETIAALKPTPSTCAGPSQ